MGGGSGAVAGPPSASSPRHDHLERGVSAPGRAQCSACHSQELQEDVEATAPRYRHEWWDHDVVAWDNITVRHAEKTCMPYINEFVRNSSEIPVIAASLCCWPAPLGLPEF